MCEGPEPPKGAQPAGRIASLENRVRKRCMVGGGKKIDRDYAEEVSKAHSHVTVWTLL